MKWEKVGINNGKVALLVTKLVLRRGHALYSPSYSKSIRKDSTDSAVFSNRQFNKCRSYNKIASCKFRNKDLPIFTKKTASLGPPFLSIIWLIVFFALKLTLTKSFFLCKTVQPNA